MKLDIYLSSEIVGQVSYILNLAKIGRPLSILSQKRWKRRKHGIMHKQKKDHYKKRYQVSG